MPPAITKIVGLDLSLTSTGIAVATLTNAGVRAVTTHLTTSSRGHARLDLLLERLRDYTRGAGLVVLEGPAHRATGAQGHALAGLWWLVAHDLWRRDTPTAIAAPAARAKYAAGKGNAGKDAVVAAVVRRYPDVEVNGNDEADALALALMGADRLGWPVTAVPKVNREALAKMTWPEWFDIETPRVVPAQRAVQGVLA